MKLAAKKAALTKRGYVPEYQRLGKTPVPLNIPAPQAHKISPKQSGSFIPNRAPQFYNQQETVEELEKDEEIINHTEISEESVQAVANVQANPYSYLVVHQGKCLEVFSSKQELEEYLEQLILENPNQEDIAEILNSIEIWKKIPFKTGIHVQD